MFQTDAQAKTNFPNAALFSSCFPHRASIPRPFLLWRSEFTRFQYQLIFLLPRYSRARVIVYVPFATFSCGGAYLVRAANLGRRRCWGVVQLVGHLTVNEAGEGSNPSAPANFPIVDQRNFRIARSGLELLVSYYFHLRRNELE
jgi:hypothetical protein